MTQALTVYKFEDMNQRIQIADDREWWCALDACLILGIKNNRQLLTRIPKPHVIKIDVTTKTTSRQRYVRPMWFVDEAGLNYLIMRSNKPAARRYQEWVFSTVLPAIRKTGSYSLTPSHLETMANTLAESMQAFITAQSRINESLSLGLLTLRAEVQDIKARIGAPVIHQQIMISQVGSEDTGRAEVVRMIGEIGQRNSFTDQQYADFTNGIYDRISNNHRFNIHRSARRRGCAQIDVVQSKGWMGEMRQILEGKLRERCC